MVPECRLTRQECNHTLSHHRYVYDDYDVDVLALWERFLCNLTERRKRCKSLKYEMFSPRTNESLMRAEFSALSCGQNVEKKMHYADRKLEKVFSLWHPSKSAKKIIISFNILVLFLLLFHLSLLKFSFLSSASELIGNTPPFRNFEHTTLFFLRKLFPSQQEALHKRGKSSLSSPSKLVWQRELWQFSEISNFVLQFSIMARLGFFRNLVTFVTRWYQLFSRKFCRSKSRNRKSFVFLCNIFATKRRFFWPLDGVKKWQQNVWKSGRAS